MASELRRDENGNCQSSGDTFSYITVRDLRKKWNRTGERIIYSDSAFFCQGIQIAGSNLIRCTDNGHVQF